MQRLVGTFAVAIAGVLCACSQNEAAKSDSAGVAQAGAADAAAASPSQASFDPTTHVAVVHAKDFAFDAPDSITAGWTTFHLVNDGPNIHHIQLVRLDSGKTAADLEAALKNPGPPPAWMTFAGGPNAPSPGRQADAMINVQPGNYVLLCFVDIPGKVPHFAKGMVRPLRVTAASGAAAPEPTADVTITLSDYTFANKGALSAGKHTIKVVNNGPQPHETELMRLAPGKTMKDVGEFIEKAYKGQMDGPPPVEGLGGVSVEPTGGYAYFTADLTPGNYVLLCFVPDAKDGKTHLEHGMVKEFKVE